MINVFIAIVMMAILFTLFRSLYFIMTDKSDPKKAVTSLRWRIGLSLGLFLLLLVSISLGWIEPHGLPQIK